MIANETEFGSGGVIWSRRAVCGTLGTLFGLRPSKAAQTDATPVFLSEPDYFLEKLDGKWRVRKIRTRVSEDAETLKPWVIHEDTSREAAEEVRRTLPRLRLARLLVEFNPRSHERRALANWTREADAQETEADIRALLERYAPETARRSFASTPVYMARLNGASGHTAEEASDSGGLVVYVDPFRATGRLHLAATLVHEFAHLERYRARGFHANRAASVLPREDFVLLGLEDELRAYRNEAAFVAAFLASVPHGRTSATARKAMDSPELRWPRALLALLDSPGGADKETRGQVVLDIERQASRYWILRRRDRLEARLERTIREWHSQSAEWHDMTRRRTEWTVAGAAAATSG